MGKVSAVLFSVAVLTTSWRVGAQAPNVAPASSLAVTAPYQPESALVSTEAPGARSGSLGASRWLLTLDHLAMLGSCSVTHEVGGTKVVETGEQVALMGGGAATGATVAINPHAVPRLALDRVLGAKWTIGAGLALYKQGGNWEASRGSQRADGELGKSWLVALSPRIGYLTQFGEWMGAWGRVGASWAMERMTNRVSQVTARVTTADLEGSAIVSVTDHVGIVPTLLLALPLHGRLEQQLDYSYAQNNELETQLVADVKLMVLALQLGIVGYW